MNRAYRLVWSHVQNRLVVAAEITSGRGKNGSKSAATLSVALLGCLALAAPALAAPPAANQLPTGGQVVAGTASISQQAARMDIHQQTDKAIINWQGFDIGSQAQVNFAQPSSSSVALNRVLSSNPSQIYGQLNANGQVYLINPNGVVFGQGSQVNVGGLVASTLDITNQDFLDGKRTFTRGNAKGGILNQGNIKAHDGGSIALIAPKVVNEGIVTAQMGNVVLASGNKVTLSDGANGLIQVAVEPSTVESLIENKALIKADGGQVIMTASAAGTLQGGIVNNSGTVQAKSLQRRNGRIILSGDPNYGAVRNSGTLNVSAKTGTRRGKAKAPTQSPTQSHTQSHTQTQTQTQTKTTGGEIRIQAKEISLASGSSIQATGLAGGGTVLIGGQWQGSGDMPQATRVSMEQGARIDASATHQGDGGTVVLWSDIHNPDSTTDIQGSISAQGGKDGGKGGQIETSGHRLHIADSARVSTQAANGQSGTWLLDPYDFTIAASGGDISGTALGAALNSNDVTIQTTSTNASCTGASCGTGTSSGSGDIKVNDAITWTTNKQLTLSAWRNIEINAPINASTGNGKLTLLYGQWSADGTDSGTTASYNVHAPVNLASGGAFTTQQGTAGSPISYTIITELGVAGDSSNTTLQGMKNALSGNYVLGSNIGASATSSWNGGAGFEPISTYDVYPFKPFTGSFDGLGHVISGLRINRPDTDGVGLFGYTDGASIRNVGLENSSVTGGGFVGILVGLNRNSSISNSTASGDVTGTVNYVGGLVGYNWMSGSISNSYASGSVTGTGGGVGGLAGANHESIISNSYASSSVKGTMSVGGLVGVNYNSSISNSYASGNVTGTGDYVGGLVGWNYYYSSISNSYASGNVTGSWAVGGLVGWNDNSSISSSFWDTQTTGQSAGCGDGDCSGATGKTTAEMKSLATFSGWDIDDAGGTGKIWRIYAGDSYPLLRAFLTQQTITSVNAYSKTYDGTAYSGGNGYVAPGANSSLIFYGGTAQGARNAGTYRISLYSNQQGYDFIGNRNANLTINKAALTVSTSDVTKTYDGTTSATGNAKVVGGALYGGDSLSGGSFAFTDKNAGTGKTVTVADITVNDGNSGGNYDVSYQNNTTSTINPYAIGLSGARDYAAGDTNAAAADFAGGGLVAGVNGEQLQLNGSGSTNSPNADTYTTADGTLNLSSLNLADYNGAKASNYIFGASTFVINPLAFTLVDLHGTRAYDGTNIAYATNFLSGGWVYVADTDKYLYLTGQGTVASKNAGPAAQSVTLGTLALQDSNGSGKDDLASNYVLNSADLLINKAAATVTANSATKTYNGLAQSVNGFTASGLVNGENEAVLTNVSTTGGTGTNAGTYIHKVSGTDGNYNLSFVDGSLSISPASLSITANDDSKVADGQPYSGGNGVVYSGFVNGENDTLLGGALAYGGTSQGAQSEGIYSITPAGLTSNNYNITFVNGALTIAAAPPVEPPAPPVEPPTPPVEPPVSPIRPPSAGGIYRDTTHTSDNPSGMGQPYEPSGLLADYAPSIGEHNGFPCMGSAFVTLAPGYVPFAPGIEEAAIAVGDPPAENMNAEDEERAKRRRGRGQHCGHGFY